MHSTSNRPTRNLATVIALLLAGSAAAQEVAPGDEGLNYTLRVGAGYTDNVARDAADEAGSAYYSIGSKVDYARETGRTEAFVAADLDYMEYQDEGVGGELWGGLDARLRHDFVEDRFGWSAEDNLGQGNRNPFQSASPGNVETINYFSTGPYGTLRFGARAGATVNAVYSNIYYEDSPNDNDRIGGGVSLFYEPSASSRAYLSGSYTDIQYGDDALAPDYELVNGVFGYTNRGARTELRAEAGYNGLEYETGETSDGPLVRLNLKREVSGFTKLELLGGYEYQDAATELRTQGSTAGGGVLANGQVFEDTYAGARLRFAKNRTNLNFGVDWHDQDYVEEDFTDRERIRFNARLGRQFGRALNAFLTAELESVDYSVDDETDYDETSYGAGLAWQARPTLDFNLSYRFSRRPSDSVDSFDESRVWLRAEWSPTRR